MSAAPIDRFVSSVLRVGYRLAYLTLRLWWFVRRPATNGAAVALWHAGKVLMVRTSYRGCYSLPGGFVRRGEPSEQAARRELREELGSVCRRGPCATPGTAPSPSSPARTRSTSGRRRWTPGRPFTSRAARSSGRTGSPRPTSLNVPCCPTWPSIWTRSQANDAVTFLNPGAEQVDLRGVCRRGPAGLRCHTKRNSAMSL